MVLFYHDQADVLSTGGIEYLRANKVETVIVGGLALDFCVKKSIEQLLDAGFKVILNLASTRAVFPENVDQLTQEFFEKGVSLVEGAADIISE